MPSSPDRRRIRLWQPDTRAVTGMLRLENEDRTKVTYTDHFSIVAVLDGAYDGWSRGYERAHRAGSLKLNEPGEVHRGLRVHAPFTLQAAGIAPELVARAADARGLRGSLHFRATGFAPGERAARLALALHAALVRDDATEIERETLVTETLSEIVGSGPSSTGRAPHAVRRARAFLHDGLAERITLDALADHARLDKFHLVRAFRAEVGVPPYEYLTHLRVARAKQLLRLGMLVAEVAQAVGFYDESQLHRHFRRVVGVPPGAYAKSFGARAPLAAGPGARTSQHRPMRVSAGGASSRHDPISSQ